MYTLIYEILHGIILEFIFCYDKNPATKTGVNIARTPPVKKEYSAASELADFSIIGRHTSIQLEPGRLTLSAYPTFLATKGIAKMPMSSLIMLCIKEIVPAITYPLSIIMLDAREYHPKPEPMARLSLMEIGIKKLITTEPAKVPNITPTGTIKIGRAHV